MNTTNIDNKYEGYSDDWKFLADDTWSMGFGQIIRPGKFSYSAWRGGGWYVHNVRYVSGAIGCVSRNYPDKKWRIVCDPRPWDQRPTYRSRDEAALAEYNLAEMQRMYMARQPGNQCCSHCGAIHKRDSECERCERRRQVTAA